VPRWRLAVVWWYPYRLCSIYRSGQSTLCLRFAIRDCPLQAPPTVTTNWSPRSKEKSDGVSGRLVWRTLSFRSANSKEQKQRNQPKPKHPKTKNGPTRDSSPGPPALSKESQKSWLGHDTTRRYLQKRVICTSIGLGTGYNNHWQCHTYNLLVVVVNNSNHPR
jgi:hypothetical protein